MNLFIVCGNLKAGGAERVVSILANKFQGIGHIVSVITWYETDVFYKFDSKIRIVQIPVESGKKGFFGQMKWFRNKAKTERPDAILSFLAPFNILSIFSLIGADIPVLVAERNDPYFVSPKHNWFWRVIRNLAYKMADGILVQTNMSKCHFPKYLQKKATVIFNPVSFTQDKIGVALRTEKRKEIVSVTRLHKQKNIKMLIRSFADVHKVHPEYRLTIYGEGELRESLENFVGYLGLDGFVLLPGEKTNVHDLIIGAEIFAMASDFEGMSNSLIEAMCLGLPCISTKVSGATDLIQDHKNGILIDTGSQKQLTHALLELIEDSTKRNCYGCEASKLYEILNVDCISSQWLNYIEKSLARGIG